MSFCIEPANQYATTQDRQHEITVLALRLGGVALEPVIEIENCLRARAIPHDRIEWREHRRIGRLERALSGLLQCSAMVWVHERRLLPAFDLAAQKFVLI